MADAPGWRFCAFCAALVLYAFSGSPTPDAIGTPEIITAILLILSVSPGSVIALFTWRSGEGWRNAGQILLLYGLIVPVIAGLLSGNALSLMIRDMIPFFFFLLPLLILPFTDSREEKRIVFPVLFIGIIFSLRILLPMAGEFNFGAMSSDPLYLSIAPTVCFAALWCAGMAGQILYGSVSLRSAVKGTGYAALALLPFAAMAITLQRASIGLSVMGLATLLLAAFIRAPIRVLPVLPLLMCAVIAVWGPVSDVTGSLYQKQSVVGMNMRLQEAAAVSDTMGGSVWPVLFGRGWGATVSSPAVGGVVVNYTHSLLTAFWMKTGLAGTGLALFYLFSLAWPLLRAMRGQVVVIAAITVPFLIDTLLYASYKSLDFGLILLLAAVFGASERCAGPIPDVVKTTENP